MKDKQLAEILLSQSPAGCDPDEGCDEIGALAGKLARLLLDRHQAQAAKIQVTREKVLETALLEEVLSYLLPKEVLAVRQVSKRWATVGRAKSIWLGLLERSGSKLQRQLLQSHPGTVHLPTFYMHRAAYIARCKALLDETSRTPNALFGHPSATRFLAVSDTLLRIDPDAPNVVRYVGDPHSDSDDDDDEDDEEQDVGVAQFCHSPLVYMPSIPGLRRVGYFEATVLDTGRKSFIGVGLAHVNSPLSRSSDCLPGWYSNGSDSSTQSFGYHGDDGYRYPGSKDNADWASWDDRGEPYGPRFGAGDTVGVGVDYTHKNIFFTKNGKLLGVAFDRDVVQKCVGPSYRGIEEGMWMFYATVGLNSIGEAVSMNVGQDPFLFDIDSMIFNLPVPLSDEVPNLERSGGDAETSDDEEDDHDDDDDASDTSDSGEEENSLIPIEVTDSEDDDGDDDDDDEEDLDSHHGDEGFPDHSAHNGDEGLGSSEDDDDDSDSSDDERFSDAQDGAAVGASAEGASNNATSTSARG